MIRISQMNRTLIFTVFNSTVVFRGVEEVFVLVNILLSLVVLAIAIVLLRYKHLMEYHAMRNMEMTEEFEPPDV